MFRCWIRLVDITNSSIPSQICLQSPYWEVASTLSRNLADLFIYAKIAVNSAVNTSISVSFSSICKGEGPGKDSWYVGCYEYRHTLRTKKRTTTQLLPRGDCCWNNCTLLKCIFDNVVILASLPSHPAILGCANCSWFEMKWGYGDKVIQISLLQYVQYSYYTDLTV